jgi:hypothetical protein
VMPAAGTAATALTITTSSSALAAANPARVRPAPTGLLFWLVLPAIVVAGCFRHGRLLAIGLLAGCLLTGCGGGNGGGSSAQLLTATASAAGTPPGTYVVTVYGASGVLQHAVALTLTVQ